MNSPSIIELEGVSKAYGGRLALKNVTLSVGSGVTGLLGPNGSGKSTMIKSLLGLLEFQAGRAQVLGFELPGQLREIREAVGYLPEDDCFISGLAGIESVCYMAELSGLPGTEALRRSHEAMDYADIGQERYRNVETYSTGMRQKLKFAQAIVHDPQLIILDEPTSGLDPEQRTSMLRKIQNLARNHGKSIFVSTHILHDVRTVCDQVIIMCKGEIRLVDDLENLTRPSSGGVFVQVDQRAPRTQQEPFPDSQKLAEALRAKGVDSRVEDTGVVWVAGTGDENVRAVWGAATEEGVVVLKMAPARNSLEQIFFNTVKEAENATA